MLGSICLPFAERVNLDRLREELVIVNRHATDAANPAGSLLGPGRELTTDAAPACTGGTSLLARRRAPEAVRRVRDSWDWLTAALVLLVVAAVVLAGAWTYVGLPGGAEGKLIDAAEAIICLWLAVLAIRARRFGVLGSVGLYIAWVLSGVIYTEAPSAGISSDLRNWLLLPVLAVLLACRGPSESRARALMSTLLTLGMLNFLLTIVQALVAPAPLRDNTDSIVGTFGASAQSLMGVSFLLIASLGVAGYLIGARHGRTALVVALVLPLFSAWGVAKLVTVAVPAVVLVTGLVAYLVGKTTLRRAGMAVGVAVISSALVLASYAIWYPGALKTFASFTNFGRYASNGSLSSGALYRAGANGAVLASWGNSNVEAGHVPGLPGDVITVTSLNRGRFGAYLQGSGTAISAAQPNRTYHFVVDVIDGSRTGLFVVAALQWRGSNDQTIGAAASGYKPLNPATTSSSGVLHLRLGANSPSGTAYVVPYFIVAGSRTGSQSLPPGSAVHVTSIRLIAGGTGALIRTRHVRHAAPAQPGTQVAGTTSGGQTHGRVIQTFLPGHFTLLHKAVQAISGGAVSELFGKGAGATSTAALAAAAQGPQDVLPNDASAGHYSDVGTLIVERGWIGVILAVLAGLALVFIASRTVRDLEAGSWSTAFTLAIPGAFAAVVAYGLISTGLQAHASALIFWLILGVGLAPWLGRSRTSSAE